MRDWQQEDQVKERLGTEFKPADHLFLDQIREEATSNAALRQAAANTLETFKYVFAKALEALFIDRMEQNDEIFARFMNDEEFQHAVESSLQKEVYDDIRKDLAEGTKRGAA